MCNKYAKGILYYEIEKPSTFVEALSREVGMKSSPSTVFNLLLGYISKSYYHYYVLPESQVASLDMVLEVLSNTAKLYTNKYGRIPVLFIDGIDLLATREPKLCEAMIILAKLLANANQLKIILVSNEGTIMSFLENCRLLTEL